MKIRHLPEFLAAGQCSGMTVILSIILRGQVDIHTFFSMNIYKLFFNFFSF